MKPYLKRLPQNPLLTPSDVNPSSSELEVIGVLNPGAFAFAGDDYLVIRVAERPIARSGFVRFPVIENGLLVYREVSLKDMDLDLSDARELKYKGVGYLTSVSHLKFYHFNDKGAALTEANIFSPLFGREQTDSYGLEDCRVSRLEDGRYILVYTAVSSDGYTLSGKLTEDFVQYQDLGRLFPIPNKDGTVFPKKYQDSYLALNRPSGTIVGGHDIWLSYSPDLVHWGKHHCLLRRRWGQWDSARIGINGPPIELDEGWLVLYHGADEYKRYCLGAFLLDKDDPTQVLARSKDPFMEPEEDYETEGFFGGALFSNGHLLREGRIMMFYGAADTVVAAAEIELNGLLNELVRV